MQKRKSPNKTSNATRKHSSKVTPLSKVEANAAVGILRMPDGNEYAVVPVKEFQRAFPNRIVGDTTVKELFTPKEAQEIVKELDDPNAEWVDADDVFAQLAAANVVKVRKAKGLTQKQLGDLLGVPQSQISRIERNPDSTSMRTMKRVAKALGVSVQQLL
jgi:DNA-binding XRE family transcriptional regulator